MSIRAFAVLVLLGSCNGKDKDGPDVQTDADADADADSDADTDISEFGLDNRPANPTCIAADRPALGSQAQIVRAFQGISHNDGTAMMMAPGDTTRWYLAEQAGRVYRFDNDPGVSVKTEVLNISGPVNSQFSEMGLLGMAFHPNFQANGELFLYYSADSTGAGEDHRSRLSRFTSSNGGNSFDVGSEEVLLEIAQPYSNHNGGMIAFGPDGFLYMGLGDGGSGGDPGNRAQNTNELLGKILRIDVNGAAPYGIPADNPYAGGGGRAEVYAIGLRNPFRFTFDANSGELWVGDVGQDAEEEISKVDRGGNYGWRITEGFSCYNPSVNCDISGISPPDAVIEHVGFSQKSIIAGVVYNGAAIPALRGTLLYNDFYDGDIFGLFFDPGTGAPNPQEVVSNTGQQLVFYAVDGAGEVVLLDYGGDFYRLEPLPGQQPDPFPQKLSQTGCFEAADATVPSPGLIPYTVAHAFWSDNADKERWLAMPDGATITVDPDGDWQFPIGTVLVKEFVANNARLETRLLMRHGDGGWAGYAYAWDADGRDATLLAGGLAIALPAQIWSVPDNAECALCHNDASKFALGFETLQMNALFTYDLTGRTSNQLDTFDHIGLFNAPIGDPATLGAFPALDDANASVEERARAYLHVNCGLCHRPDGPTRSEMDWRFTTALADTNTCNVAPEHGDLDVNGATLLTPGNPALSLMSLRMHRRDASQMPPIGSNLVDSAGAAVVDDWITSLTGCN